jgi:hypothetical protein
MHWKIGVREKKLQQQAEEISRSISRQSDEVNKTYTSITDILRKIPDIDKGFLTKENLEKIKKEILEKNGNFLSNYLYEITIANQQTLNSGYISTEDTKRLIINEQILQTLLISIFEIKEQITKKRNRMKGGSRKQLHARKHYRKTRKNRRSK